MAGVTKEDLADLASLAMAFGKARGHYATLLERAHHIGVPPESLARLEAQERGAWNAYAALHNLLAERLEGEKFMDLVAPIERPTIYTLEDLEALPDDTVVLDETAGFASAYQKGDDRRWYGDGRSYDSGQIHLPVTIIWKRDES